MCDLRIIWTNDAIVFQIFVKLMKTSNHTHANKIKLRECGNVQSVSKSVQVFLCRNFFIKTINTYMMSDAIKFNRYVKCDFMLILYWTVFCLSIRLKSYLEERYGKNRRSLALYTAAWWSMTNIVIAPISLLIRLKIIVHHLPHYADQSANR